MKSLSCGGCGEDVRPGISCLIKDRMVWHAHCVKCAGCGDIVLPFESPSSDKDSLFCFDGHYYCGKCRECNICSNYIDVLYVRNFPTLFTTRKNESNGLDIVHCECLGCECGAETCAGENTIRFPRVTQYMFISDISKIKDFRLLTMSCARFFDIYEKILLPAHVKCSNCNKPMGEQHKDYQFGYNIHPICDNCGECITDSKPNIVVNSHDAPRQIYHKDCATCYHCGEDRPVKSADSIENCRKFYQYRGNIYHNDCIECENCSKIVKGRYVREPTFKGAFSHYTCPKSVPNPKKKRKISKK